MLSTTEKSKKNKKTNVDTCALWNVFDAEVQNPDKVVEPLECIYRTVGNREFCERCSHSLSYCESGFLTCTNGKCGIIYKDMLDHTAEWRYYGADDSHSADPTRCGMAINPLLEESSFGCRVLCGNNTTHAMRKIRQYTERITIPYKEKALYNEFQKMTTYAHNSNYSKKIIDDAIYYHKRLSEYEQNFRGDNKEGLIIGALSISCKVNNTPRTAKELATTFRVDTSIATHGCKMAHSILNHLEKDNINRDKTTFNKTKPESFIERYCSKLNMNGELTKVCMFIAIKIEKNSLMLENTPHSIAAGIVFFVAQLCNLAITKSDVKKISEISEVTINKCSIKLEKLTSDLVPPVIIAKYSRNK